MNAQNEIQFQTEGMESSQDILGARKHYDGEIVEIFIDCPTLKECIGVFLDDDEVKKLVKFLTA